MKLKLKESFSPQGYTKVITAINENMENDTDTTALQKYLQDIINYCKSIAKDYNILIEGDIIKEYSDNPEPSYDEEKEYSEEPDYDVDAIVDEQIMKRLEDKEKNTEWILVDDNSKRKKWVAKNDPNYIKHENYDDNGKMISYSFGYEYTKENEEATQVEDIAKKVEYKKMVTPEFKVGSKI